MNKVALFCASCALTFCSFAERQVYRLERDSDTEQIWLVGQDGLSRECKILSPEQYDLLMGDLLQTWTKLNSTDGGRAALHGHTVGTVVTNGCLITKYKDGYSHSEQLVRKTSKNIGEFSCVGPRPKPQTIREQAEERYHTKKYYEFKNRMKERSERIKNSKPKTVNIVHDASTGNDILVEEGK